MEVQKHQEVPTPPPATFDLIGLTEEEYRWLEKTLHDLADAKPYDYSAKTNIALRLTDAFTRHKYAR